ncbi:MAG: AraC family transcriptional regulator, partial [Chitinophagaceae bacterium]|nr:AraC family transcriptional regulator [Rubrivivax sp.]
MPYQRQARLDTPVLAWHELALQAAAPAWSPAHQVDSPRLLLPLDGAVGCWIGPAQFVCDPLVAVWLTPAQRYRLRQPVAGQRSTVLL